MRREELLALSELAGEIAGGLTERVHETHAAIAHRAFDLVGPAAAPVALMHDGIAGLTYGAAGSGVRLGARAAGRAVASLPVRGRRELGAPGAGRTIAWLNGIAGDHLEQRGGPLANGMTLRLEGQVIPLEPTALGGLFPQPGGRVAVLVHGLGGGEAVWRERASGSLSRRLARQLGMQAVTVRYNSGRPVEDNGRALAELLRGLLDAWPATVQELVLVGHDLGGVVCHRAVEALTELADEALALSVVTLGAPHLGLASERLLARLAGMLDRLPETRPVARALGLRSAGLRDGGAGRRARLDPRIRYLFISGNIAADPTRSPVSRLGDLVVSRASAWANPEGEPVRLPLDSYREIGGVGHFALPGHPAVHETIAGWLAPPSLTPPAQLLREL